MEIKCSNCEWYENGRCGNLDSSFFGEPVATSRGCFAHSKTLEEKIVKEESIVDNIKPSHYRMGDEVIPFIRSWDLNFNLGNVVKYITRAPYKGKRIEDLRKAKEYLEREIEYLENSSKA